MAQVLLQVLPPAQVLPPVPVHAQVTALARRRVYRHQTRLPVLRHCNPALPLTFQWWHRVESPPSSETVLRLPTDRRAASRRPDKSLSMVC